MEQSEKKSMTSAEVADHGKPRAFTINLSDILCDIENNYLETFGCFTLQPATKVIGQSRHTDGCCRNIVNIMLPDNCDQPSVEQSGGTLILLTLTRLARFLQTFPRQSLNVSGTVSCGL